MMHRSLLLCGRLVQFLLFASLLPLSTAALGAEPAQEPSGTDDSHGAHVSKLRDAGKSVTGSIDITIPDTELITQHGVSVKLASDVIGDKLVVIDFIYTTCTTVCPVLSAILSQVQAALGDRLGHNVVLVSISVDPTRDNPARLKAYANKLRARDGWLWLTGNKSSVDRVLKELGAYTPNFEDHPAMVLVGDGLSGEWGRFLGFPGAEQIMNRIDELSAARAQAAVRE